MSWRLCSLVVALPVHKIVTDECYCYSINDINSFNLERIITVKGSIENMSKAEAMISAKLRQSYENDLQAMAVSFFFNSEGYLKLLLYKK